MRKDLLKQKVTAKAPGTIRTITYEKPMKTLKAFSGHEVIKTTKTQVRLGCKYDNLKVVKERRENGALPVENAGLAASLQWIKGEENYFLENTKTGKQMLRCTRHKGNKPVTKYFVDGKQVSRETVKAMCQKSEFPERKDGASPSPIFNIDVNYVKELH